MRGPGRAYTRVVSNIIEKADKGQRQWEMQGEKLHRRWKEKQGKEVNAYGLPLSGVLLSICRLRFY
ncbi:hypothetical protein M407DRAFT_244013 [Tulasnella calospora MUT 4182]|uniref:Uncharacterized protein n=1 Tax=Tulasnella calospora MUT 4182 TaxID=1051891 RepID=A0A0C3KVZ0_9AGAM|nr:hypothetical protein M407DRAFT_244013 [Tulasnella calospora MUT 4182]